MGGIKAETAIVAIHGLEKPHENEKKQSQSAQSSVAIIAACCLPHTSAVAATLWTPTEIATIGWYDASVSGNVVTSGTNVTSWNDISGNGYHLNQAGSSRPTYGSSTINGLNAIDLSSTFSELYRSGIADIDVTQLTVISVGMPKAAGDFPNLGSVYSTDLTDKLFLRLQNDGVQGKINSGGTLNGTNFSMGSGNVTDIRDDVPVMLAAYYDGFNAVSRVNGGALSVTTNVADGATFTINEIQIGRDSGTPRNYHGEMIVLGTADLATIELAEGYLAWKWGTQDTLPGGHAYKLAAPVVIPEPSSLALMGLSTLGLLFRRRR